MNQIIYTTKGVGKVFNERKGNFMSISKPVFSYAAAREMFRGTLCRVMECLAQMG